MKSLKHSLVALTFFTLVSFTHFRATANEPNTDNRSTQVYHRTVKVDGLDIFYREAGTERCSHGIAAARVPDFLAHVPKPDPGLG